MCVRSSRISLRVTLNLIHPPCKSYKYYAYVKLVHCNVTCFTRLGYTQGRENPCRSCWCSTSYKKHCCFVDLPDPIPLVNGRQDITVSDAKSLRYFTSNTIDRKNSSRLILSYHSQIGFTFEFILKRFL